MSIMVSNAVYYMASLIGSGLILGGLNGLTSVQLLREVCKDVHVKVCAIEDSVNKILSK